MSDLTRTECITELVERFQQELEEQSLKKLRSIYNYFEDNSILNEFQHNICEDEEEEDIDEEESDASVYGEDGDY